MIAAERLLNRDLCRRIAIVGAGFCGATLATRLLQQSIRMPLRIMLVERSAEFARGAAFAACDFPYLLNVPASRMSADADDPQQFSNFAGRSAARSEAVMDGDYFPRALYGDYLQSRLGRAARTAPPNIEFSRVHGTAQRIATLPDDELRIDLSDGRALFADDVVIATGNPSPAVPQGMEFLRDHPAFIDVPWSLPSGSSAWKNVAILGTGLSMVDVFSNLNSRRNPPVIHAISRRGLLPLAQNDVGSTAVPGAAERLLASASSIRALMRTTRDLVKTVEHFGGDWRPVVNLARSLAPDLWKALPVSEQLRFVRHVRPFWDIHRHRLPPTIAAQLAHARRAGKLHIHAGRLRAVEPSENRLKVVCQKSNGVFEHREVDVVINATGPDYRLRHTRNPLMKALLGDGLISADAASLGIRTNSHYAVIGSNGRPAPNLFYLGPLLRASHWEATAVAELRKHVARLATALAVGQLKRSQR